MTEAAPRRIVVLNGPSSAGKTTLGRALQRSPGTDAVFLSIDLLWTSVHPDRRNDWPLFEALSGVLLKTAFAFWRRGATVIVDTVFERQARADQCLATLAAAEPVLVGLCCDVGELERREIARGDRPRGLAARQVARVHGFCGYDVRLDTDRTTADEGVRHVLGVLGGRR